MAKPPQSMKDEQQRLVNQSNKEGVANGSQYELWRKKVFYFMERPESKLALTFHIVNLVLIVGSIIISVLSTIDVYETDPKLRKLILYYELTLLAWFTMEYILRVWSCCFLNKYKGCIGTLKFMKTLYMLIDAFVIISTLITAILHMKTAYFSILRITRFLQIFRILRLDRQRGDLQTMGHVVYKHRKELVTCYFVGFIILFGGTYIIYVVEKLNPDEPTIDNMANGLYWAMITVTSVGYGDISPKSWAGKLITGVFALVGCAFFALPAGILGSGFALQVAKQKKQKRYIKVRNPAAIVIQTCWRNCAIHRHQYQLQATWYYFFPQLNKQKRPDYYETLPGIREIMQSDAFPTEAVAVLNEKAKYERKPSKSKIDRMSFPLKSFRRNNSDEESTTPKERKRSITAYRKKSNLEAEKSIAMALSSRYKAVIRFIVRVKLWNSIKHFKTIRYPFVNVQDIMEKNATAHLETISHLKAIHESIAEFRTALEDMKLVLNELCTAQNPAVVPLTITIDEHKDKNESIDSVDKITDVDVLGIDCNGFIKEHSYIAHA